MLDGFQFIDDPEYEFGPRREWNYDGKYEGLALKNGKYLDLKEDKIK